MIIKNKKQIFFVEVVGKDIPKEELENALKQLYLFEDVEFKVKKVEIIWRYFFNIDGDENAKKKKL